MVSLSLRRTETQNKGAEAGSLQDWPFFKLGLKLLCYQSPLLSEKLIEPAVSIDRPRLQIYIHLHRNKPY